MAGIEGATHHARKTEPRQVRVVYNTPLDDIKQAGRWDQPTCQQVYVSVIPGDALSHLADFNNRDTYTIPRQDLHPSDFPGFQGVFNGQPTKSSGRLH